MSTIFSEFDLTLNIQDTVLEKWAEHRQLTPVITESCGVLIGGFDTKSKHFLIESITLPLPMDVRKRMFFTMQDKGHQKAVDTAFKASGGKHIYLGTWHTHPELRPSPSEVDLEDWIACIKRNDGRQLFFVIVGTEEIRVFVCTNNQFKPISLIGRSVS